MSAHLTVLIVDDHKLFRDGLTLVLESNPHIKSIQHAGNGEEALEKMEKEKFDIAFLDITMPLLDGASTAKIIKLKYQDTKLIVLSMHEDKNHVFEMYDAGVAGYLLKSSPVEDINMAIQNIMEGKTYFVPAVAELIINRYKKTARQNSNPNELTNREREILKLICRQLSNQQIAEKLFISARTVETYRESLLKKTKSKNTIGLVMYAMKNGWVKN